jgi:hypothetical protein
MDLLHALRKLRQSIAPRRHYDVEKEFRFHVEAYEQDLIRHGLTREEAGCKPANRTFARAPRVITHPLSCRRNWKFEPRLRITPSSSLQTCFPSVH